MIYSMTIYFTVHDKVALIEAARAYALECSHGLTREGVCEIIPDDDVGAAGLWLLDPIEPPPGTEITDCVCGDSSI